MKKVIIELCMDENQSIEEMKQVLANKGFHSGTLNVLESTAITMDNLEKTDLYFTCPKNSFTGEYISVYETPNLGDKKANILLVNDKKLKVHIMEKGSDWFEKSIQNRLSKDFFRLYKIDGVSDFYKVEKVTDIIQDNYFYEDFRTSFDYLCRVQRKSLSKEDFNKVLIDLFENHIPVKYGRGIIQSIGLLYVNNCDLEVVRKLTDITLDRYKIDSRGIYRDIYNLIRNYINCSEDSVGFNLVYDMCTRVLKISDETFNIIRNIRTDKQDSMDILIDNICYEVVYDTICSDVTWHQNDFKKFNVTEKAIYQVINNIRLKLKIHKLTFDEYKYIIEFISSILGVAFLCSHKGYKLCTVPTRVGINETIDIDGTKHNLFSDLLASSFEIYSDVISESQLEYQLSDLISATSTLSTDLHESSKYFMTKEKANELKKLIIMYELSDKQQRRR